MKQAIIDIGSNSIRLTLYETEGQSFKILFREKIMAGLAGYVEDGKLSAEGIECACAGLLTFRKILQTLQIENIRIFATASLRNVSNTERALSVIRAATGFSVEVISGEDEALFGYAGARALGGGMIVTQTCAKNSGLAHLFADNADKKRVSRVMLVWELVLAVLAIVLAKGIGALAVAACAVFYVLHVRMCRKNFGGITGDLCGMCITVCETVTLLCAVIGGMALR